jgi:hypothetical protein
MIWFLLAAEEVFDRELDLFSVSVFDIIGVIALKLFSFSYAEFFSSVSVFSIDFLPRLRFLAIARQGVARFCLCCSVRARPGRAGLHVGART